MYIPAADGGTSTDTVIVSPLDPYRQVVHKPVLENWYQLAMYWTSLHISFFSVFVLFCSFNHWAGLCWMAECCRSGLLNHQHCSRASRCAQIPALHSLHVWWLLPNSLSTFTPMPVSIFCAFCGFVQMLYYLYFPGSQNSFVIFFLFC